MIKTIVIASFLGVFSMPSLAAESGFLSKLEQGVRDEANTQLQGIVGGKLESALPEAAGRALKPATQALAKDTVNAGADRLKPAPSVQDQPQEAPELGPVVKTSSTAQTQNTDNNDDIIIVSKEIENCAEGPEYLDCVTRIQNAFRTQHNTAIRKGDKARAQAISDANSGENALTAEQQEKIVQAKKTQDQLHQDMVDGKIPYPGMAQEENKGATYDTLVQNLDDLFAIPALPEGSKALPYCGNQFKTNCIAGVESLKKMFSDDRTRMIHTAAYRSAHTELLQWSQFYNSSTGEVSFSAEKMESLKVLQRLVENNNRLVREGLLHPMDLVLRECVKKQIPVNRDAPKPDTCKGGV